MSEARPLFEQVAEQIEDGILDGTHPEDAQVPSTNEFAAFLRINPATAGKGVNLLVDRGVLYKRRGIGMFVTKGARDRITAARRSSFVNQYLRPLLREARALGMSPADVISLIDSNEREGVL